MLRLAVKPPLPRICVLRSTKLCCAVEDENSFDRHAVAVLKDGRVVGHVHVAIFLQNIAGGLAARLLPPATRLHGRMTASGNRPRSVKRPRPVLKLFSARLIHEYNSSALATRVYVQELQYSTTNRPTRGGGRVMEVKYPFIVISPEIGWEGA